MRSHDTRVTDDNANDDHDEEEEDDDDDKDESKPVRNDKERTWLM